jgi:pantetheine-phosphate adenylyltransferase
MDSKAVYAGSFDPLTNGHMWMIEKGAELFDQLVVAVGVNPQKDPLFDLEERSSMLKETLSHVDNIETTSFGDLFLVDFADEKGAEYILRGLRNESDFEYESSMRHVNSDIAPDIDTLFMMPPRDLGEISSSMVKGLVGPEGWEEQIRRYVPESVARALVETYET